MENFAFKNEIIVDKLMVKNVVHDLLVESEQYNIKCLDLEDSLVEDVTNWINNNKVELSKDFKNFQPKILPLMSNLELMLKSKMDISRIDIEGSNKNFRLNKVAGVWAVRIYDSILINLFKPN